MKSILLIGLGRFGKHIALHLNHLGHQVMAVDASEERVELFCPLLPMHRLETVRMPISWNLSVFATMMYALWPSATTFKVRWKQLLCSVN